jgi:hypothetical protein
MDSHVKCKADGNRFVVQVYPTSAFLDKKMTYVYVKNHNAQCISVNEVCTAGKMFPDGRLKWYETGVRTAAMQEIRVAQLFFVILWTQNLGRPVHVGQYSG